jgi:dTDP-4-dehydrorhamnose 3,5-epimerase
MIFTETKLKGAYLIDPDKMEDERGFFARTFCRREFEGHGLRFEFVQCSISVNRRRGTLRGMHFQTSPHQETKLVSCMRGAIYDVIIDLRPNSPTYCEWLSAVLTEENRKIMYIPEGFAHGFQTLDAEAAVFYQISEFYDPYYSKGLRWDDPRIAVEWPYEQNRIISQRDQILPFFNMGKGD